MFFDGQASKFSARTLGLLESLGRSADDPRRGLGIPPTREDRFDLGIYIS